MSGDRLAKIERACHARIADKDLAPQLRGEARDVLALVEIAKAARDVESWRPQLQPGLDALHPQDKAAIIALRTALARLDSGAAE